MSPDPHSGCLILPSTPLRSALVRSAFVILSLLGAIAPALAQISLTSVDIRLPSGSTGGGTLAVRVTYPSSTSNYRYPDGAPVAIYLPGGFNAGTLYEGSYIAEQGFVLISFLYPGGNEGAFSSDGTFDYRGNLCQLALLDVIRYASGAATDSLGRTLDALVPGSVHPGMVGFAAYSNSLIGLITLDRYGASIPITPYQTGWENPTNDQILAYDLGINAYDCNSQVDGNGDGIATDDGDNPFYDGVTGYGATSFTVDYSRLSFDPSASLTWTDPESRCSPVILNGVVFLDGSPNGVLDYSASTPGCLDFDGDGLLETTEDFRLGAWRTFDASCNLKLYYSRQVTQLLASSGIFGGSWPSWLATAAQAAAFWNLRDSTVHWDGVRSRFPDFHAMTVYTKLDHVESQPDHPHVRQVMDGAMSRGLWYRLNADAVYYAAVNGSTPPGYVETPAKAAIPSGQMKTHAEPIGTNKDDMMAAAQAEMADRLHAGCWWADLGSTIQPGVTPAPEVGAVNWAANGNSFTWSAPAGAFCYDVIKGTLRTMTDNGQVVALNNASCLEEDSPDTTAVDTAVPLKGKGFYYLVKPNGVHGSYGSSSAGHPRQDVGKVCRY